MTSDIAWSGADCTPGVTPRQLVQSSSENDNVAARKLALAGRPAGQALSALWYLGRRQVTPATFERIAAKLPQIEFEALRSAKASMPAWMIEALRRYEEGAVAYG